MMPKKLIATDRQHLAYLVDRSIERDGLECNLNYIDVSQISLFIRTLAIEGFNGDVSKWNVSNALRMDELFDSSAFTGNVAAWNTSRVVNMSSMFRNTPFNGDVSKWDVSKVEYMHHMFEGSSFAGDLTAWNFSTIHKSLRDKMLGFMENIIPNAQQSVVLPTLDIACPILFGTQNTENIEAMHTWLQTQSMGRYHWDVLLQYNDAPWATTGMREHAIALAPLYRTMDYTEIEIAQKLLDHWNYPDTRVVPQLALPLIAEDFLSMQL